MSSTETSTAVDIVSPLAFMSIAELYETPDETCRYVVDNLLPSSGLSILSGKPKAGKSTLVRQLAVAVAQGAEFLGRKTTKGAVLYVALEEKISEIKSHFQALRAAADNCLRVYCRPAPQNALHELERVIRFSEGVNLVIIDPIFRFIRVADSNDYSKVNEAFEPLLTLARNSNIHMMAVHHMKKRSSEDNIDNNLGSTAITGGVDTYLALNRTESGIRVLSTRQRYGTDMEETQLVWDPETRRLSLGVTCEEAGNNKNAATERRIEAALLKYIADHPNCTKEALFEAVTGKTMTKNGIFRQYVDQGLLIRSGSGDKGNPYTYALESEAPIEP